MKKIILLTCFLLPVVIMAQKGSHKTFPKDYIWQNVGQPGFSAGIINWTSLAVNPSGQPYVAYVDQGNSNKATVMKFDGTQWMNVGAPGFSAGTAVFTSLAMSSTGQPFVSYMDYGNATKASVMTYNGTSWVYVGNPVSRREWRNLPVWRSTSPMVIRISCSRISVMLNGLPS